MSRIVHRLLLPALIALLAPAAPAARPTAEELAAIPSHPEAEAYYKANTNFFRYATSADLPAGLKWDNGLEEKPFASPDAKPGGTLRLFIPAYPDTLRTIGPNSNNSFRDFLQDLYAPGLVHLHPDTLRLIPALAREWAVSEDQRTAYFRLDEDARFTDGQPITVDDYFFLFYFSRSPHVVAPWYNDYYTREFESITRYDDYTMAVTLPRAKPNLVYHAVLSPKPRRHYKDFGPGFPVKYDWVFEPHAGAYRVLPKDEKRGESIALTKVPDWWAAEKPFFKNTHNVDRIEVQVIRDTPKAFEVFKLGELDYFPMSLPKYWYDKADIPEIRNGYIHKVTFYNDIPQPTYGIYMNSGKGLLANHDIRLGVQHALDWNRVINGYFRGDYDRMQTFNEGYGPHTHPGIHAREFNPDKAMDYFAKAGFDRRGRDGILRNAEGRRLSLQLTVTQGERERILAPVVDSARKAGLELRAEALDSATAYRKVMLKNHDMTFWAWGVSGIYPRYWESWHKVNAVDENGRRKEQTNNITSCEDEEMSALIDRHRDLTDEDEMIRISHRLQEMIHEHASYSPGFVNRWYRIGHWRWLRFPAGFDVKRSSTPVDYSLYWIDEDLRRETLEARKTGRTFPPVVEVYDQWRTD